MVTRLDRVRDVPRPWLWPGRLPLGEVVVVTGMPMSGKSSLLFTVAACVSGGLPWPDGADNVVGNVPFLAAEDGISTTLRPRLRAAGGRVTRVQAVEGALDLSSPAGLLAMERHVAGIGGVRLIVIDPLTACLSSSNNNSEAAVRRVMTGLRSLADRRRLTIITVLHTGKNGGGRPAMLRSLGSVAFTAVPRTVYMVLPDPTRDGSRLMLPVKFSFGPPPPGVRFRIAGTRSDPDTGVVRFLDHDVRVTADEMLRGTAARPEGSYERAERFLREQLADGPVPQVEIRARAERAGIAASTIERVKRGIGIRSFHPPSDRRRWWYELTRAGSSTGASGSCSSAGRK